MSPFGTDSPAPFKPSYYYTPGEHVDCNLMRDPELEVPVQVVLNSLPIEIVDFPLLVMLK